MQTSKSLREKNDAHIDQFTHQIGSTVYTVSIIPNKNSKETLEDKMLRMMKSDLTNEWFRGKISLPQVDWLPERSPV